LCPAGSNSFDVGIIDANACGLRVITVVTDTYVHAQQCAATMLRAGEMVRPDPEAPLRDYDLCIRTMRDGDRSAPVRAFDDFGARSCACMGMLLGCTVVSYTGCP